jgi:hypothetical protein
MVAEFYETDSDPPVKWVDGVTHIRDEDKSMCALALCCRSGT